MKIISRKEAIKLGLKRYFTGKPCCRGHVCERSVSYYGCVKCRNLHVREYDKANPEKRRARELRRAPRHAYKRAYSRAYRIKNLEKVRSAQKQRYLRQCLLSPEKFKEISRRTYEKRAAAILALRLLHPELAKDLGL